MSKQANKKSKLHKVLKLLDSLVDILKKNYTKEISFTLQELKYCIKVLNESNNLERRDIQESIDEVIYIYIRLFPPRGGLSDFFIWKENYSERIKVNEDLENIKKELWQLLEKEL